MAVAHPVSVHALSFLMETSSGAVTWDGTGTTVLTNLPETTAIDQTGKSTKDTELQVTGTVKKRTGAARKPIPAGDTVNALVCLNTVSEALSLDPQQRFTIAPAG
jgi:hypothetical protein